MPRRLALFSLVIATVSASSVFSTTASLAEASAAELCFGQVPTIVGEEGEAVVGTDGPDVVVSHGGDGAEITTGDGDDLVCVIGAPEDSQPPGTLIYAGNGNDRVDNSRSGFNYVTYLGLGADEYVGGPAREVVSSQGESQGPGPGPPDHDVDVIMTGGASDRVASGGSDRVDLGGGRDSLYFRDLPAVDGVFTGGPRSDVLYLKLMDPQPHSWTINNRAERLLRDGQLLGGWDSFRRFELLGRTGPLKFLGSGEDERLGTRAQLWPLDVRMGGGDDKVVLFRGAPVDHRISGGNGTDTFAYGPPWTEAFYPPRDIYLDLSSGVLRDARQSGGVPTSFRAVNFENAHVTNATLGRTVMRGTSGPNVLSTSVEAGATVYGMDGDDVMVGSYYDDVLIGGSGHDEAYGSLGIDRCEAELQQACER